MGNRKSREFRLEQERQASWDRLRAAPWNPHGHARAFGSGQERVQLVRLPSFSPPGFREVCQRGEEWLLYTATVVDHDGSAVTVRGYEPVDFPARRLKAFFDCLVILSVPLTPHLNYMGGADGTVTQLAIFGDMWSQVRFQWWSDPPPGWSPLVEVAEEMLAAFGAPAPE